MLPKDRSKNISRLNVFNFYISNYKNTWGDLEFIRQHKNLYDFKSYKCSTNVVSGNRYRDEVG